MTIKDQEPASAESLLHVSYAPHLRAPTSVPRVMLWMLLALAPLLAAALWFHAMGAMILLGAGMGGALAAHACVYLMRRRHTGMLTELSPLITGFMLVLTLPVQTPWWMVAAGSFFAILISKEAFGGLGHNFMNPALAGRVFLQISYPAFFAAGALGGVVAPSTEQMQELLGGMLWGNLTGALGNVSVLAVLAGAVLLWYKRLAGFRIPFFFIVTTFFLFWVTSGTSDYFSADALIVPCFQILSGGLLFGAFFCACDPVTSPMTPLGKIAFGTGCGVLTFLFRRWGAADAGVWFAIIIMNCFAPLFDHVLRPRYFGEVKKRV